MFTALGGVLKTVASSVTKKIATKAAGVVGDIKNIASADGAGELLSRLASRSGENGKAPDMSQGQNFSQADDAASKLAALQSMEQ